MDMILSPLVDACTKKLVDLATEKVGMILGVKDELMELQRRLLRLSTFLEDAEKKSIEDKSIKNWLGELKDFVYDAEDILDIYRVHSTRLLEENLDDLQPRSTTTPSVRSPCLPFISCFTGAKFRHEMAKEIKKLNNRLREIDQDSSVLSKLNTSIIKPTEAAVGRGEVDHRPQTTPVLAESEIVWQHMEEATQLLVESLINEEDNRKYSVFGIVGMGGIGKTTLASKLYSHASIAQHFSIRIWVCVSRTYSETDLFKQIIRGARESYGEANTKAELEPILVSALSRNFFLVLDDVWSADVWEKSLKKPLACVVAAKGRVLITTRNENITKQMFAKEVYEVQKMNNSDGWVLLCKKVFGDYGEEEEILGLKDIGIQIVDKCDGLPLAIEVIGGVLRTNDSTRRSEWEKILRSDVWSMDQGELRGSLYLSYKELPTHLKQCFLYCSLYPEDKNMNRDDIIRYWIAEGFIRSEDGGDARISMEDIADDYYLELIRRSLLQVSGDNYNECRMHDMLRSLAQKLIGNESVCLVVPDAATLLNANTGLRKLRRMSVVITEEAAIAVFDTTRRGHLRQLRTLLFFDRYNGHLRNNHFSEVLCYIRVLSLNDMMIENLPDSFGKLVHLRHLGLDGARISGIPDSIQNLVNLQYVILSRCRNLHILPRGITQLYNLRYLDISRTPLICMPKELGRMKQLNHLVGYSAGDQPVERQSEGCNMDELRYLFQMRRLSMRNLHRATTGIPAVTNKPFLKEMFLDFRDLEPLTTWYRGADIQRTEKVMEELLPPSSIQLLEVHYYPGREFPCWMSKSPSSLAIVKVGPEFAWGHHLYVNNAFPQLVTLQFEYMSKWEEWSLLAAAGHDDDDDIRSGGGGETSKLLFPRLKELVLNCCFNLRSLPAGLSHANSLQSMSLSALYKMTEVNQLPRLTHLVIAQCPSLQRISQLPLLRKLEIPVCLKLKDVTHLDALCFLFLSIDEDEEDLPAWLLQLAATRRQMPEAHSSSPALPVPQLFLWIPGSAPAPTNLWRLPGRPVPIKPTLFPKIEGLGDDWSQ